MQVNFKSEEVKGYEVGVAVSQFDSCDARRLMQVLTTAGRAIKALRPGIAMVNSTIVAVDVLSCFVLFCLVFVGSVL